MTGLSSTAWRRRRCGCFSRPNSSNIEEDRGSSSGSGNNGTPNDRRSGEERNKRRALPATAVNLLDSAKRAYRRWREGGGWWNNEAALDDDGNNSSVVEELRRTGRGRLLTRPGGLSTWLPIFTYQYCRMGRG